eukprot:7214268-Alexandrium_andersonii.AAC.1
MGPVRPPATIRREHVRPPVARGSRGAEGHLIKAWWRGGACCPGPGSLGPASSRVRTVERRAATVARPHCVATSMRLPFPGSVLRSACMSTVARCVMSRVGIRS